MNIHAQARAGRYFTNETCMATRPCDHVFISPVRGEVQRNGNPRSDSTLGRLRARTGLAFDLPTEWQWEYACRAGDAVFDASQIRNATNVSIDGVDRNSTEEVGTSYVDRYAPNAWGFYGMLGNVWEMCLDCGMTITKGESYVDPCASPNISKDNRTARTKGGGWKNSSTQTTPYQYAGTGDPWNAKDTDSNGPGVRIYLAVRR